MIQALMMKELMELQLDFLVSGSFDLELCPFRFHFALEVRFQELGCFASPVMQFLQLYCQKDFRHVKSDQQGGGSSLKYILSHIFLGYRPFFSPVFRIWKPSPRFPSKSFLTPRQNAMRSTPELCPESAVSPITPARQQLFTGGGGSKRFDLATQEWSIRLSVFTIIP